LRCENTAQVVATVLRAAWEQTSPDVLKCAWDIFGWIGDWQDAVIGTDNEEYQIIITIEELGDIASTSELPT
jgi:hypothetical protein